MQVNHLLKENIMCLVTSQLEPYIAPVDIPVVKVLLREGCYLTYFRRTVVKLNRILQPYEDYKRLLTETS